MQHFFSKGLVRISFVLFLMLAHTVCNAQWVQQFQGSGSLLSVSFADASTGWMVGSQSVIYKTTNGGARWVPQFTATGPETYSSVCLTSPNDVYIIVRALLMGNTDKLYVSRDGGSNFSINRYGLFQTLHFRDVNNGYLVGINGNMLRTVDGARTWDPVNTGTS